MLKRTAQEDKVKHAKELAEMAAKVKVCPKFVTR